MIRKGNLNMDPRSVLPFPHTTSREVNNLNNIYELLFDTFINYLFFDLDWLAIK